MVKKERFYTNPGNPIHIIYRPSVDKDGNIELVESGKENTDDIIQSYTESCDIVTILARACNGEPELLNQRQGTFGDFTQMPKTFAEVLQLQIDSNRLFDSLPGDVKDKFGNDPNKFFVQAGTKEWAETLGDVLSVENKKIFGVYVDSEVKESEVKE